MCSVRVWQIFLSMRSRQRVGGWWVWVVGGGRKCVFFLGGVGVGKLFCCLFARRSRKLWKVLPGSVVGSPNLCAFPPFWPGCGHWPGRLLLAMLPSTARENGVSLVLGTKPDGKLSHSSGEGRRDAPTPDLHASMWVSLLGAECAGAECAGVVGTPRWTPCGVVRRYASPGSDGFPRPPPTRIVSSTLLPFFLTEFGATRLPKSTHACRRKWHGLCGPSCRCLPGLPPASQMALQQPGQIPDPNQTRSPPLPEGRNLEESGESLPGESAGGSGRERGWIRPRCSIALASRTANPDAPTATTPAPDVNHVAFPLPRSPPSHRLALAPSSFPATGLLSKQHTGGSSSYGPSGPASGKVPGHGTRTCPSPPPLPPSPSALSAPIRPRPLFARNSRPRRPCPLPRCLQWQKVPAVMVPVPRGSLWRRRASRAEMHRRGTIVVPQSNAISAADLRIAAPTQRGSLSPEGTHPTTNTPLPRGLCAHGGHRWRQEMPFVVW